MYMIIWYNQQEPLNFMIMIGMAQERGSKGPQKWLAGIWEPHPSGLPSSFCSWSTSNLWCISLGCFIFRLFWEDPWFQKRTSLVRTRIQPSNVTSSGSMGKSLGRCEDARAAMAAIASKCCANGPIFGEVWLAGQTCFQEAACASTRLCHNEDLSHTFAEASLDNGAFYYLAAGLIVKWGWVNAYPTVVGMNVHLPGLSSFTRVQTGSTMGLIWTIAGASNPWLHHGFLSFPNQNYLLGYLSFDKPK